MPVTERNGSGWIHAKGKEQKHLKEYNKWKHKESKYPVNFGKYIGEEWQHDPGAIDACTVLGGIHNSIKQKVGEMRATADRTDKDIEEFKKYLESIYFPKDEKNVLLGQEFITAVAQSYQQVYDLGVHNLDSWDTNNLIIDNNYDLGKVSKKIKELESRSDATVKAMGNRIQKVTKLLEDLNNDQSLKESFKDKAKKYGKTSQGITLSIQNLKKYLEKINEIYNESVSSMEAKGEGKLKEGTLDWKRLAAAGRVGDKEKAQKTIKEFNSLYVAIVNMFLIPPDIYGSLFEWSLAVLNRETPKEDEISQLVESEIYNSLKQNAVKGQTTVERGGNTYKQDGLNINVGFNGGSVKFENGKIKSATHFIKRKDVNEQITMGNITINNNYTHGDINTGKGTYGKTDVTLTIPDKVNYGDNDTASNIKGKTFKISAKNWGVIDNNEIHTLGTTSLLRGIDRSISEVSKKQTGLLNYLYVLQQPTNTEVIAPKEEPSGRRQPGTKALEWAHKVAKESLVLDIAVGFSQHYGKGGPSAAADTLVVLDRAGKRIIVIDLIEEAYKLVQSGIFTNLVLENYNEAEIESSARELRNRARQSFAYKQRDVEYVKSIRAYLETQKAIVRLNSNYNTFKN